MVTDRSSEYEDKGEFLAQLEKAMKLFDSVIENCGDEVLKSDAIDGMTLVLSWLGRYDDAKSMQHCFPKKQTLQGDLSWKTACQAKN